MKQYLELLEKIKKEGVIKESGRKNMPNTVGLSNAVIKMDMNDGFPLLTTKKMFWKGIAHELLWFLRGDTNIKYLVDNGVNIWNQDAYRWYLKWYEHNTGELEYLGVNKLNTIEEFIDTIKSGKIKKYQWSVGSQGEKTYVYGDLGKVYGHQWRNQNGVDQVKECLVGLQTNPYSRYHIIDGWNKADFNEMALPPCHLLYQFIVRPLTLNERIKIDIERNGGQLRMFFDSNNSLVEELDKLKIPRFYLDLNMYQRSCDVFLGVPFNLASMSLLLHIFAKACNMIPGVATWFGGDTHIYINHLEQIEEQLSRKPHKLPELVIDKHIETLLDIETLKIEDFKILNYKPHPTIKAELFTGLKKQ